MKIFIPLLFIAILSASCAEIRTEAQIRSSANGSIVNSTNQTTKAPPQPKLLDLSAVDFKNFTFPDFSRDNKNKSFTLKNGQTATKNSSAVYTLRKTYFFDLTGDRNDEAISHILVNGCDLGCESSSFFFIYTADGKEPKLLWKIAIGGDTMGGLKAINFKSSQIVLETFGECSIEDWLVKADLNLKNNPKMKTTSYTRFVFTRDSSGFTQTEREVFPLANPNINDYRPQITFNE